MGIPFYGQSFSLMENAGTGLGESSYAGGNAGDETRARGFLSFYEVMVATGNICSILFQQFTVIKL